MADPYNDEPTAEELALLQADEQSGRLPPAEDDETNSPTPERVAAEAGVDTKGNALAEPAGAPPAAGTAPTAEPSAQTEDQRFQQFMAQHAGKSPEELTRLAFQQTQRAQQAGFQARQGREQLEAVQERARAAMARAAEKRSGLATKRAEFNDQLATDPDAATRAVHERLMSDEERQIEEEERNARLDAAIGLASSAIPDFQQQAPTIMGFGAEMGYSNEELGNITDGRDLVMLYLASIAGRQIKAGIIDNRGQFVQMPQTVAATDPRLQTPAPVRTLSTAPARGQGGGKTIDDQLIDIGKMSDADFDKLDASVLENILRQAG